MLVARVEESGTLVLKPENMKEVLWLTRNVDQSSIEIKGDDVLASVGLNGRRPQEKPPQKASKPKAKKPNLAAFAKSIQAGSPAKKAGTGIVLSPQEEQRWMDAYRSEPGFREAAKVAHADYKRYCSWAHRRGLVSKKLRGGHPNPAYKG